MINRFKKLPNTGYLEIWIQRIAFKIDEEIVFEEPICKILSKQNAVSPLWNSDWIGNNKLKKIIDNKPIVDEKIVEEMDEVIKEEEVSLFGSKDTYW